MENQNLHYECEKRLRSLHTVFVIVAFVMFFFVRDNFSYSQDAREVASSNKFAWLSTNLRPSYIQLKELDRIRYGNQFEILGALQLVSDSTTSCKTGSVEKILMCQFSYESRLAYKRPIAWALAYCAVKPNATSIDVRPLQKTLTEMSGNPSLAESDRRTLLDIALVLGFVSNDQAALQFISAHTSLEEWQKTVVQGAQYDHRLHRQLTSYTIHALGISGSKLAQDKLDSYQASSANISRKYLYEFADDIAQAKFYAYLRAQDDGRVRLLRSLLNAEERRREFDSWVKNVSAGKQTVEWANQKSSGPAPD